MSNLFIENQRANIAKIYKTNPKDITDDDVKDYLKQARNNELNLYGGIGAVTGAANIADKVNKSGQLDGIVKRYHNTEKKNVDSIKKSGILSSHSLDADNITSKMLNLNKNDQAGKVYLAHDRKGAKSVGLQRQNLSNPFLYRIDKQSLFDDYKKNQKTLNVNIPFDEYKKMDKRHNPELGGATNYKEYKEVLKKKPQALLMSEDEINKTSKQGFKLLGKRTDTIQGDIPSRFIKGGKNYKSQSIKGLAKHIKNNPAEFTKGLGKAGTSAALGLLGGKLLMNSMKPIKRKEKTANELVDERFEKIAGFSLKSILSEKSLKNLKDAKGKASFPEKAEQMGAALKNKTLGTALDNIAKRDKAIKNKKIGAGVGAGVAALGSATYGLKKLYDKEKTASEIVNERFAQIYK